jgi:hypothetical protein
MAWAMAVNVPMLATYDHSKEVGFFLFKSNGLLGNRPLEGTIQAKGSCELGLTMASIWLNSNSGEILPHH